MQKAREISSLGSLEGKKLVFAQLCIPSLDIYLESTN